MDPGSWILHPGSLLVTFFTQQEITMRRIFLFLVLLALFSAGCKMDNSSNSGGNNLDVSGTWQGAINFATCTPAAVCASAGFSGGGGVGILILSQNGSSLNGSFTYQGAGITSPVNGTVTANSVVVDGGTSNPFFGSITVHLQGTVSGNAMPSNVSHHIILSDGRTGDVSGSGQLNRQ
jgi:hypothetical protein